MFLVHMYMCIRMHMHVYMDRSAQNQRESQQYVGPSIRLGGTLLQWTGPPLLSTQSYIANDLRTSHSLAPLLTVPKHTKPQRRWSDSMVELCVSWATTMGEKESLNFRVLLEGEAGSIVMSTVDMENCGTTVIYFSWKVGSPGHQRINT